MWNRRSPSVEDLRGTVADYRHKFPLCRPSIRFFSEISDFDFEFLINLDGWAKWEMRAYGQCVSLRGITLEIGDHLRNRFSRFFFWEAVFYFFSVKAHEEKDMLFKPVRAKLADFFCWYCLSSSLNSDLPLSVHCPTSWSMFAYENLAICVWKEHSHVPLCAAVNDLMDLLDDE